MNRPWLLFLVLALTTGFAMAEDDELGLAVALEFGIEGMNKPNDSGEMYPSLTALVMYERPFLDGALYLYSEFDYTFGFTKIEDSFSQDLFLNVSLSYSLNLGEESILSFHLENSSGIVVTPAYDEVFKRRIWGNLRPGVRYSHYLWFIGDLHIQADAPIMYLQGFGEDSIPVGLDIKIGWESNFGLGVGTKLHFLLAPSEYNTGFTGFDMSAFYYYGNFTAELGVRISGKKDEVSSFFDGSGNKSDVSIIPEVQYKIFPGLVAYGSCAFGGIGGSGDIVISPSLGVRYNF